ncbi:uncharacterized protein BJ212DRAFT_1302786 [Suillus subaureus]|uniref:Uncharacterized protein n=1 Tax=Suillus subaureus TaxID=48587 RepID=A0A9P7J900_9AGAM|nr:uncharacterized protein BJ212DRAFT_1302786 [Suillus subaureus]KAG1808885.1 hypothetical protein BJ212DRAFT_1302786 [Suillus subaureus]
MCPNIVVCEEEKPDLNNILAHDKNLVDVVLAVGVHPIPHSNYSTIIKQFSQAAQSRAQIGVSSTTMMDQDMPTLEKAGIQDLFQVSLVLDLQDFFGHIVVAAYQDAVHNPASNTMVISRKPELMDFSMKQDDEEDREGGEEGGEGGGGGGGLNGQDSSWITMIMTRFDLEF